MVQIDMEMPKNCSDCPLNYDMIFCSISETKMSWSKMDKERLPDCPLKELKENNNECVC